MTPEERLAKAGQILNQSQMRQRQEKARGILGRQSVDPVAALGGGITEGLIQGVGGVVDLSNFLLGIAGMGSEKPVGGTEHLTELARKARMVKEEGVPETPAERIGETIGASVAAFAPLGAVGRFGKASQAVREPAKTAAGKIKELAGGAFRPAVQSFRETPGTFAAAEAISAVGAGIGGEAGRQVGGDSLLGEVVGEIIGGGGAVAAAQYVKHMPTLRLLREVSGPFRKGGSEKIAAQIVQGSVTEPKAVIQKAKEFPAIGGTKLPMGARAGSDRLLSLERAIVDAVPELKNDVLQNEYITNRMIKHALVKSETEEPMIKAANFFKAQQSRVERALHLRLMASAKRMNDKITKLGVEANREDVSKIISGELEGALKDARGQEKLIWNALPQDQEIGMSNTRDAFERYVGDEQRLPEFIRRFYRRVGGLLDADEAEDVVRQFKDVKEFRTELLEYQRLARASGNAGDAFVSQKINEAILQDIAEQDLGDEFAAARSFSKELNDRFTRGRIGEVLRFSPRGGRAITEEMVSESLMPANAPRAAQGVKAARKAVHAMPEMEPRNITPMEDGLQQVVRMRLFKPNGEFDIRKAQTFVSNNAELLRQFPELETEIVDAVTDATKHGILKRRVEQASTNLIDKRRSSAALIVGTAPEKAMKAILSNPKRGKLLAQAVRGARKDQTGAALEGLQDAYFKNLMEVGLTGVTDDVGEQFISGTKMRKSLVGTAKDLMDSGLFNKEQIKRINIIVDNALAMERKGIASAASREALESPQGMLSDFMLSVIGANIGAKFAGQNLGAPLVAASRGASLVRKLVGVMPHDKIKHILADAVRSDAKMEMLLNMDISTPAQIKKLNRMNAWLFDLGIDASQAFQEQQ